MSDITFEFATRDDCLDKMVPSDLRMVVADRDRLIARNRDLEAKIASQAESVPNAAPTNAEEHLQALTNKVVQRIPRGMVLSLCMENGAAWVQLNGRGIETTGSPSFSGKPLIEQIHDALSLADNWDDWLKQGQ